ncbi:MAG TPA: glutamate racemase [Patescibacteria group bacterium]|jgi:glutamate racemase|nr:glutamate racemase [Patescibacteria group bacterium]
MEIAILKKRPIGIFDSGVGGLTVLKELRAQFPYEDFVYYADTAHIPYGNKTTKQVIYYSECAIQWMIKHHDVKMIIIACHTSSACCANLLQKKYLIPIIDTIQATVYAVLQEGSTSIALLATERTVQAKVHEHALRDAGYKGKIIPQACPEFVPLIEKGIITGPQIEKYIRTYCTHLAVTAFVYGCTHYPFIEQSIKKIMSTNKVLINPAHSIATQVKTVIENSVSDNKTGSIQFHVTGDRETFFIIMKRLLKPSACIIDTIWKK